MTNSTVKTDFEIVTKIVSLIQDLDKENQVHVLKTVGMWLKIKVYPAAYEGATSEESRMTMIPTTSKNELPKFSDREVMSPKDFLIEKDPQTDVERVACIAYYLTHYCETAHLKTLDISKMNTEAAQSKFTNAAVSVRNATNAGLLASVSRGKKQLSAMGEQFVQALPDREEAMAFLRRRRKRRVKKATGKREFPKGKV